MCRCLGRTCAVVLMLAAAGCTLDSFLMPQVVYGPKATVADTAAEVSAKLQDGLSEAGIMWVVKRVGDDLRIAGVAPKSRTAFCVHLKEKRIDGRVQTLVRMQWDRGGDEELWQQIRTILNLPPENGRTPSHS